jgi:hypothetical protein
MDEYVVDVLIDGHKETLKSFGNSIYSIIDSMITLESVDVATRPAVSSSTCNTESNVFAIVCVAKVAIINLLINRSKKIF